MYQHRHSNSAAEALTVAAVKVGLYIAIAVIGFAVLAHIADGLHTINAALAPIATQAK
jgi:hypothetical protein